MHVYMYVYVYVCVCVYIYIYNYDMYVCIHSMYCFISPVGLRPESGSPEA